MLTLATQSDFRPKSTTPETEVYYYDKIIVGPGDYLAIHVQSQQPCPTLLPGVFDTLNKIEKVFPNEFYLAKLFNIFLNFFVLR